MNRYTIPCTEEQLRKALELGAPLDIYAVEYDNSNRKDNEFNIINDIVFDYGVTICHNEYGDLVYVTGETNKRRAYYISTAEQMIGWLRSKGMKFYFNDVTTLWQIVFGINIIAQGCSTNKELAAIDAALEYLGTI